MFHWLFMFHRLFCLVLFFRLSCLCYGHFEVNNMSLEEKVGQLLMVHFNGELANAEAELLIQELHVGGIIYYNWANGLHSPAQVLQLSTSLQNLSAHNRIPIPLFIAVDQEGGLVSRLTEGFTLFPGNKALGISGDRELAAQSALAMGRELLAVGVNFNLAPVVDVNSKPQNPVIGIRSFSENVDTVISFADKSIQGYHQAGIIVSLKHYPGHGDVAIDSHYDLPFINKSKNELEAMELLPFQVLGKETDAIMTAHLIVPAIDPIHCVTLSKIHLDFLRNEMGFQGLIISDSLVMEGLLKNCPHLEDAAIRALNAGCDILLLGGKALIEGKNSIELTPKEVKKIHQALVDAVQTGIITEDRLNDAVQRILQVKNKYFLLRDLEKKQELYTSIHCHEHRLLAKKIASLALKSIKKKNFSIPSIDQKKVMVFAPACLQKAITQTSLLQLAKDTHVLYFEKLNPTSEEKQMAIEIAAKAEILLFVSYDAWKNPEQASMIRSLLHDKKPLILIVAKTPLDEVLFPEADLILTTFSPVVPSLQAACEFVMECHAKDSALHRTPLPQKFESCNENQ